MIRSTLNNNPHRIEHINVFSLIFQQPARQILRNYFVLRPTTISRVKYKLAALVPQQLPALHSYLYAQSCFCNGF
jgi:hypothetical protein